MSGVIGLETFPMNNEKLYAFVLQNQCEHISTNVCIRFEQRALFCEFGDLLRLVERVRDFFVKIKNTLVTVCIKLC